MHADAFFVIGKTHKVCEDYARAGEIPSRGNEPDRTYAVVCDGCSSSADTDVGARFLALAAIQGIATFKDNFKDRIEWAIWSADHLRPGFLNQTCLDSTLLVAYQRDDGMVDVGVTGDGVVAAKRQDGSIEVWEIDFQGAPAYLSYALFPDRMLVYADKGYKGRTVQRYSITEGEATKTMETDWHISIRGESGKTVMWDNLAIHLNTFDPAVFESVMVMSDGVHSFQDWDAMKPVSFLEVVPHLMDVKGYRGEFMTRRCRSFLNRFCAKHGWQHNDDLGVAGIYMGAP